LIALQLRLRASSLHYAAFEQTEDDVLDHETEDDHISNPANTLGMSSWFWKMYQPSPAVTTARAEHQLRYDERAPGKGPADFETDQGSNQAPVSSRIIVGTNFERPLSAALMVGAAYLILGVTFTRVGKIMAPRISSDHEGVRDLRSRMDKSFRQEAFGGRLLPTKSIIAQRRNA
jgi:hypothetical protein